MQTLRWSEWAVIIVQDESALDSLSSVDDPHPWPGAPVSPVQRQLESELVDAKVPRSARVLRNDLYKAIFVERLTLAEMGEHKVGNLKAAYQNIHELVKELVETLREIERKRYPNEQ